MGYMTQWNIGTATGNETVVSAKPLYGCIKAIYIKYDVTPNVAADVTIETLSEPVKTILTVTNNNTSGWYYPMEVAQDTTGADVTYDGTNEIYIDIPISDHVKFTVAQGDADQEVTVWVLLA